MSTRVASLLTVTGWAVIALAAVTLLLQLVVRPGRIVATVQALTPWMLLPLAVVAIAAAAGRRIPLGAAAVLAALGLLALVAPLVRSGRGPMATGDERIDVMTANVQFSNDRIDAVAETIARLDPDVVALGEIDDRIVAELLTGPLAERYSYRVEQVAAGAVGVALWSKHPLAITDPPAGPRKGVDATAATPIGSIRFVVLHPPPPVFEPDRWNREIEALPDVSRDDVPTVILGDFNASWFHPNFRRAVTGAGLRDALADVGRGMTMTWPADGWFPAFVGLDHVLVDGLIAVDDAWTTGVPGSDHDAVLATLAAASG